MSLYDDWKQLCETERSEAEYKKFWNGYFDKETAAYEKTPKWHRIKAMSVRASSAFLGSSSIHWHGVC